MTDIQKYTNLSFITNKFTSKPKFVIYKDYYTYTKIRTKIFQSTPI